MTANTQTSQPISVEQAIDLWYTVPKRRFSDRALQILKGAENFRLPFGKVELAVSTWGDSAHPLVILVHGWGAHRAQLASFVPALQAKGYRVASFDAPAHGDSPGIQTQGFEIASAMQALISQVGDPYAIVSHSFGGLATNIALSRGVKPQRLVFTGPLRRLSDALKEFVQMNRLDDEASEAIKKNVVDKFGEDAWERTSLDIQLPKYKIPALIVHDRKDDVIPYLSGVAIARAWKSARLFSTSGLGHRSILRSPRVINEVAEFIAT